MGDVTGIAWTDHTFNPWIGCTAVSPACDHCYAETLIKRWGGDFATRRRTAPANWRKPRAWNRAAAEAGVRRRVFCASLADVFDNKVPVTWREDLFELIRETPSLDWQLLTKRPQNVAKTLPPDWGSGYPNVWLGTTVENQAEADRRIPHLLAVPAAVRFLSCEPLLGPVQLHHMPQSRSDDGSTYHLDALRGEHWYEGCGSINSQTFTGKPRLHWIIVGGESGPGARSTPRAWVDSLVKHCRTADVAVFVKQVGTRPGEGWPAGITGKGDDPTQWPAEMRVQEFPATLRTQAGRHE